MVRSMLAEIADRFVVIVIERFWKSMTKNVDNIYYFPMVGKKKAETMVVLCKSKERKSGKIWLRRDGTDLDIGQQILDEGVTKKEMVIGFYLPKMRSWSDFAVV